MKHLIPTDPIDDYIYLVLKIIEWEYYDVRADNYRFIEYSHGDNHIIQSQHDFILNLLEIWEVLFFMSWT